MLTSTIVMPVCGMLSDLRGHKRILLVGLGVFLAGSVLCGLSRDMVTLIAFRAVQGIGGGAICSSVFTAVADLFPPSKRGRYTGLVTSMMLLITAFGAGTTLQGMPGYYYGEMWTYQSKATLTDGATQEDRDSVQTLAGGGQWVQESSMEDGMGADVFVENLKKVIEPIGADDEVICFGDIIGGSPLTNTLNTLSERGLIPKTVALGGMDERRERCRAHHSRAAYVRGLMR